MHRLLAIIAVLAAVAYGAWGVRSWSARSQDDVPFVLLNPEQDLGWVEVGQSFDVEFAVENRSDQALSVLGSMVGGCTGDSCYHSIKTDDLSKQPSSIAPHSTATFACRLKVSDPGETVWSTTLYIGGERLHCPVFQVRARTKDTTALP